MGVRSPGLSALSVRTFAAYRSHSTPSLPQEMYVIRIIMIINCSCAPNNRTHANLWRTQIPINRQPSTVYFNLIRRAQRRTPPHTNNCAIALMRWQRIKKCCVLNAGECDVDAPIRSVLRSVSGALHIYGPAHIPQYVRVGSGVGGGVCCLLLAYRFNDFYRGICDITLGNNNATRLRLGVNNCDGPVLISYIRVPDSTCGCQVRERPPALARGSNCSHVQ